MSRLSQILGNIFYGLIVFGITIMAIILILHTRLEYLLEDIVLLVLATNPYAGLYYLWARKAQTDFMQSMGLLIGMVIVFLNSAIFLSVLQERNEYGTAGDPALAVWATVMAASWILIVVLFPFFNALQKFLRKEEK